MSNYDDIFDDLDLYLNEDYDFLFDDLENLDEGKIYTQVNPRICISVDADRGERNLFYPYFKITDGTTSRNGSKIARISFDDHRYIIHKDRLLHWELSNKDIKIINKILNSTSNEGITIFEKLLNEGARMCECHSIDDFIIKYHVNTNPDISDIHYNSQDDYNRARRKGIAK